MTRIVALGLIAACVVLFVVSLRLPLDSRARFLANWWAVVSAYFALVAFCTGELIND